jgi:hypothetical protein
VALDFVGRSPKSFFAVLFVGFAVLDLFALFLEFGESGGELVAFIGEFAHLAEKDDVGEVKATVLVVV